MDRKASMDRKISRAAAQVVETRPITLAGVDTHPGLHALRTVARRITTPLLPDDYLRLANPLWSARELRGRILEVRRETQDSATLVIKPGWGFSFDYEAGQYMGIGLLVDGRWRWRSYSLTSSPVTTRPATRTSAEPGRQNRSHRECANGDDHGEGDAGGLSVDASGRRASNRGRSCDWPCRRAISCCPIRRRRLCCSSPPARASLR